MEVRRPRSGPGTGERDEKTPCVWLRIMIVAPHLRVRRT
jgi:hypothetical protein